MALVLTVYDCPWPQEWFYLLRAKKTQNFVSLGKWVKVRVTKNLKFTLTPIDFFLQMIIFLKSRILFSSVCDKNECMYVCQAQVKVSTYTDVIDFEQVIAKNCN